MPIHDPPLYRYPLFDQWDKEAFAFLKEIGRKKVYPKLTGTEKDKNTFLIAFVRTQKSLHDWRDFLKDMIARIKQNGVIDTALLNELYPPERVSKEKPAWATYKGDEIVSDFIDELATRPVRFIGSDEKLSEFTMRFALGQLCHDWESTIMMIWEMLGDGNVLEVKKLNEEMKHFDYLKIFA